MLSRRVMGTTLNRILVGVFLFIVFVVFATIEPQERNNGPGIVKQCRTPSVVGERPPLVFIKPRYKDSLIISNMFYYLGLKNNIQIAVNKEHPTHWYLWVISELLMPEIPPRILAAEQQFDIHKVRVIMPPDMVIIGYLKYPIDLFMSCLQKKVSVSKNSNQKTYGVSLDTNINTFLNTFDGNTRGYNKLQPESCINELSMTLGLDTDTYNLAENNDEVVQGFVNEVEKTIDHFIIEENLIESMFLLSYKFCLEHKDLMFLQKIPDSYEGAGFGGISDTTKERLESFLKFDMRLYNRIYQKFDQEFGEIQRSKSLKVQYQDYKSTLSTFEDHCVMTSKLSADVEEYRHRQHPLTDDGKEDVQCRILEMGYPFLSNLVMQIQDQKLGLYVSSLIQADEKYDDFLSLLFDAIND